MLRASEPSTRRACIVRDAATRPAPSGWGCAATLRRTSNLPRGRPSRPSHIRSPGTARRRHKFFAACASANSLRERTASSIEAATWMFAAGLARAAAAAMPSRIRSLVMGRRADDRIEGRRQRADDFVRLLVARRAGDEDPVVGAMDRHEACQRLPDAVGGVTDVDDGERVLTDDLEAAGPARLAQAGAYRGFDPVRQPCAAARAAATAETGVTAMAELLNWNAPGRLSSRRRKS